MTLQGSIASPPALAERLEELEARVSRWFGAIRWILLTLLAAAIAVAVRHYIDQRPNPTSGTLHATSAPAPGRDSALVARPDSLKRPAAGKR
jgi:hypothetical protein